MKKYTAGVLPFFTAILILSALILPRQAAATVGFATQWPATPTIVSNTAASPVSGKFSVGAGSNRLLVVAVATEYGAAQAPNFTVTYGGQSLNGGNGGVILNNTTGNNKIWIGYLKEAGIVAAGSNKTLTVTPTITTGLTALYATAAVFSGVDQTTPITGSGSIGRTTIATTTGAVTVAKTANAALTGNEAMTVYLVNWNNNVGQTTAATNYTELREYIGANFSLSGNFRVTTGTANESINSTTTTSALGALGGFSLNPAVRIAAVSTCGDCHRYPPGDASARNVPPAMFRGSHEKHSGGNDKEYGYACSSCHYNVGGTAYNHSSGFKNITGSRLPGNAYSGTKKIAININPTLGTCNNTACHSTGRVNAQYTQSAAWGTSGTTTCLSCHAGRSGALGAQANSTAGFKLSTTHSQHLKYPAANMNCNHCHGKTATDAATLKNYTATLYHADGTANVVFTDLAYGSANSYQGDKKCSNVSCHGGTSRSAWSNNGATNNNHTCTHCHGTASGVSTANTNRNYYAPGYNGGTSTDGISSAGDMRVGGHFVHLSSVYMSKLKCNECHSVPSTPFEGNHMTGPRYNSASINFSQASTAIKNATSTAFVAGTAVAPATCTTTYCHGSKMLLGDTAGTDKSPLWNANLTTGTPGAAECTRCHGNPPNSVLGSHNGIDPTTSCVGCHVRVVDITGKIINKSLHLNGLIESEGHPVPLYADGSGHIGCASGIGCHANSNPSAPYPTAGTAPDCRSCHKKADPTGAASCDSCHGTGSTGNLAAPSGTVHPDQAAAHPKHVTLSLVTSNCVYCHNTGGTGGNADHGPGNKGTNPAVVNVNQGWNGTTCNASYCHSTVQVANGGAGAPTYKTTTAWAGGAAMTCASCHGNTSANLTTGSHATHLSTTTHATYNCANCHTGFENGNTTAHSNQIINVQQSLIKGSTGTYSDSAGAPGNGYGSCTLSYCHSSVQSTTGGALIAGNYKTVNWGGAALNCGSCHGNTNTTLLTGTHAKHLAAPFSYACSNCHGTAGGAGNTAIHANETINLDLTAKGASATYTGDSVPQSGAFGACNNTVCHGKNSSNWGSAGASSQACTECHGQVNTAYLNVSSAIIAPGGAGVDTAGNTAATSARVGTHQAHLLASSNISDKIHCGECHTVHTTIEAATHLNYTTATVTFGPLAKAQAHTTASVSRVSGLINCSNTYCHSAKTNTGTGLTPVWNNDTYLTATTNLVMADCKKCHNMPPANSDHTGIANLTAFPAATCNCHTTLSASATTVAAIFTDKTRHIDGIVDQQTGCKGCHSTLVAADFVRPSRHVSNGTTTDITTDFDCIVCHAEGDPSSSGSTITRSSLHTGTGTTTGSVDLRNVDNSVTSGVGTANTNYWVWPNRRANGALAKGSANTTARNNMDSFCMGCHDANGSSTIAVNNSNNGLTLGATVISTVRSVTGSGNTNTNSANLAQRPFNTNDKLQNTRDTALTGNNGTTIGTHRLTSYGRVLNVRDQFNSTDAAGTNWASHHNLNQFTKRYTTNSTVAGTGLAATIWTNYVTKENITLNATTAGAGPTAGLHCSDCHLNEVNAHGSVNSWYMLNGTSTTIDTDIAPTLGNSTTTAQISCFRCHSATQYALGGGGTASNQPHSTRCDNVDAVTGTAIEAPFGNMCHGCHGGFGDTAQAVNKDVVGTGSATFGRGALGAIHGNNETYTPGGGSSTKRYRFMSGASMRFWNPNSNATTNWTTTTAGTCYTLSAADQWGSCTQHSGGRAGSAAKGRSLAY